jgi:hypothetical protein
MVESLLFRACNDLTQFLAHNVGAWGNGGRTEPTAQDITDVLPLVLAWPAQIRQLVDSLWKRAVNHEVEDFQTDGESVLRLVDDQIHITEGLRSAIVRFEKQGATIRRGAELEGVLEELKRIRADFAAGWPEINEEILAESREEYERGEYQSAREILDELQGKNP